MILVCIFSLLKKKTICRGRTRTEMKGVQCKERVRIPEADAKNYSIKLMRGRVPNLHNTIQ